MGVTALALALLLTQEPEPVASVVSSVELRLPPDTDPKLVEEAPELVAIRKGQQLSVRAVQRTIQRLMNTGRFADVVVYGEQREDGLALVIDARPRQKVGQVFVEKMTGALSETEVRAASKLEGGSEYSPEAMAEAMENVRQAYRRKGYLHAVVEHEATVEARSVDVVLQVSEGEPTRLHGVSFAGETGLPLKVLLETLDLELGEVVDQDLVEKGAERLRKLLRKHHYFRARIEVPVLDEGGRLSIPLRAGPRYELQFRGNRRYPDSVLEAVDAYDGNETLDRSVVDRMAQRLTAFYRYRGFHDARVTGRESVSPDDREALLVMEVDEGEVVVVRDVEFEGNHALSDRQLKGLLAEVMQGSAPQSVKLSANFTDALDLQGRVKQPALFDVPAPSLDTVLVEGAYREAANGMRSYYRDMGYLEARVELLPVEISGRVAKVKYQVSEGTRVFVEEVKYLGGPEQFPSPESSNQLVGEPFSPRSVERTAQSLATQLARRGWVYAKVEGEWSIERGDQAKLLFRITLGPQVKVGRVQVRGLVRTSEAVTRQQLRVIEGEVLDPDDLLDSQRNLMGLGVFRTAEVRLSHPEIADEVKDVEVVVVEGPRLQFAWSFGYYLAEGIRGGVDLLAPNLGGRAVSLQSNVLLYYFGSSIPSITGRVDVSNVPAPALFGGRWNFSVQNRGFLSSLLAAGVEATRGPEAAKTVRAADIGGRVDVLGERVFRQSYQFNRVAVVPGIDWTTRFNTNVKWARPKLTLLLQYEFDVSDVRPVQNFVGDQLPLLRTDQERLRFPFGTFALSTVRFAPLLDFRDDPVLPHRGVVLSTSVEATGAMYARGLAGEPKTVKFIKVSGQVSGYIPLGPSIVLALSARAGNIFPLSSESVTPVVKRFFLGGASNLRGFPEDGMLPQDVRSDYRGQVTACGALAIPHGCTDIAQNIRDGKYVPSPGGELYTLGKGELRLPFVGDFNVALFMEAGNLWLDRTRLGFAVRPVAGAGLRYLSPIGPLALDIGFNLQPDFIVNESLFNVHFNVGVF
ncbi:MAG: BamA/TamA family outer membrane protein [Archangiaceae bacterium]|nr:BamA/TamA family outer membrane protein [Archangiaceae bacterium]